MQQWQQHVSSDPWGMEMKLCVPWSTTAMNIAVVLVLSATICTQSQATKKI